MHARNLARIATALLAGTLVSASIATTAMAKKPGRQPLLAHDWDGGYFGALFTVSKFRQKYAPIAGTTVPVSGHGKLAAFMAGYNHRHKTFVYSAELDLGTGSPFSDRVSFLANLRARTGLAMDNTLPYISAGLTLARVRPAAAGSQTKLQTGLIAGAGIEQLLSQAISGRLEYNYAAYFKPDGPFAPPSSRLRSMHIFRAGISIHLNH